MLGIAVGDTEGNSIVVGVPALALRASKVFAADHINLVGSHMGWTGSHALYVHQTTVQWIYYQR
jgi:hypothetical protein